MATKANRRAQFFGSTIRSIAVLSLMCFSVSDVAATDDLPWEAKGYQESGYDLSQYENVNLGNGNLTFRIPLTTIATDGGLSYDVSLYYNSKFFSHRHISYGSPTTPQRTSVAIADGVESFGVGWDLRPPRLQVDLGCKTHPNNPCNQPSLNRPLAYIDPSGGKHYLYSVPPWQVGSDPSSWDEYLCEFSRGSPVCYSWDGTNIRATASFPVGEELTRPIEVVIEDGSDTRYVLGQRVDLTHNNSIPADPCFIPSSECEIDDFREDVSGFYLSAIERGPRFFGQYKNRIEITYCDETGADCGPGVDDPWLPYRATANASASGFQRRVTYHYVEMEVHFPEFTKTFHVLDALEVPAFNPTLDSDTAVATTIELLYREQSFRRDAYPYRLFTGQEPLKAPFLEMVAFPDGSSFAMEPLLDALPRVNDWSVTLPSGATVAYRFGQYPIPRVNRLKLKTPDVSPTKSSDPVVTYCSETGGGQSFETTGLWRRIKRYLDAGNTTTPRPEVTEFMQHFNCSETWPYDFNYELDFIAGPVPRPGHYLFTVVASYPGEFIGSHGSGTDVSIHRFNPRTYDEFSADHLVDVAAADFSCGLTTHLCDNEGAEVFRDHYAVLRHDETERALKSEDFPRPPDRSSDHTRYVRRLRSMSNPLIGSNGVAGCYEEYDHFDPDPPEITCLARHEERSIDQYFNPTSREVTATDSVAGTEIGTRRWETEYVNPDLAFWALSLDAKHTVCDDPGAPGEDCRVSSRVWEFAYRVHRPKMSFVNPVGNYPDYVCSSDCSRNVFGYDDFGNLTSDTVTGGRGLSGFDHVGHTTTTTHQHGRPVEKTLVAPATGAELLLWTREIDPNTGLARWHVDGSGAGFAALYNEMGKITDMAPVVRDATGSLELQTNASGHPLRGTSIAYEYPDDGSPVLLRHVIKDQKYLLGSELTRDYDGATNRETRVFDGLGRLTQLMQSYPGKVFPIRSRFELHEIDTDGIRSSRSSEWVDGVTFPDATDPIWTRTLIDNLGRPVEVIRPDGTLEMYAYGGDAVSKVERDVVSHVNGTTEPRDVRRTTDILGRLRTLDEEVAGIGGLTTHSITRYGYDVDNHLIQVLAGNQSRSWNYSPGGYLLSSFDPERNSTFHHYDPLGNVELAVIGGVLTDPEYDNFGRLIRKMVAGGVASELEYGDPEGFPPVPPGTPKYGKVISSTQHNRFESHDVSVTHNWDYLGPGHRISQRETLINDLGSAGDTFAISYEYDLLGNIDTVVLPQWNPLSYGGCRPPDWSETRYTFQRGSWLTGVARFGASGLQTIGQYAYHPNGRAADLIYGAGLATLSEDPDDFGMARPERFDLSILGANVWGEGPYAYDGSGNIARIGQKRYAYDGLDRLTAFSPDGGASLAAEYGYDRHGNLTSFREGSIDLVFGVDAASNRLRSVAVAGGGPMSSVGWDDNLGNLTSMPSFGDQRAKNFFYSDENRLLRVDDVGSVDQVWRYAYDAGGERIAAWRRGNSDTVEEARFYLRDEGGKVISEWLYTGGTEPTFGVLKDYHHGSNGVLAQRTHPSDALSFLVADHLGSTRVVFDESGQITDLLDYYPFGRFLAGGPIPGTSHLFTGHERDLGETTSELDYMHARYYSNGLGRFLSVDPVEGAVESSQSWNRYTYALQNPLNFLDPSGTTEVATSWGKSKWKGLVENPESSLDHLRRSGIVSSSMYRESQLEVGAGPDGNFWFAPGSYSLHSLTMIETGNFPSGFNRSRAAIGDPRVDRARSPSGLLENNHNQRAQMAIAIIRSWYMNNEHAQKGPLEAERFALGAVASRIDEFGGTANADLVDALNTRYSGLLNQMESSGGISEQDRAALLMRFRRLLNQSDPSQD